MTAMIFLRQDRAHVRNASEQPAHPTSSRIVSVGATSGATVSGGQVLPVLEAMKVQMRLTIPCEGITAIVHAQPGALIHDSAKLVSFEPA